jgi:23S rRNA pseudouridine955/2504/2580 synthase
MIGNPILGDDKYGNFKLNKKLQKAIGLKRLLLHASRLVIKEYNLDVQVAPPWGSDDGNLI